jgi:Flp pilus assembly protein TadG
MNMNLKKQTGQSMVEFALVLPLLLVVLLGVIEFGLVLYDKAVITNASREGARAGVVFMGNADPAAVAKSYCQGQLITFSADTPVVTVTRQVDRLTVTVDYNYRFLALPKFITLVSSLPLRATTVMRLE